MLSRYCEAVDAAHGKNPWSPENAPTVTLL
jgi:hypothetical protein